MTNNLDRQHANRHSQYPKEDIVDDILYVVTTIFNPKRYNSRIRHYTNFEKHVLDSGAHLVTIECSLGQRNNVITEALSDKHTIIHVRTEHEFWLKENLINVAISRLSHFAPNWKYVATIDADMSFVRHDWVQECLQQLQHYPIVQMFSQVCYLGPNQEVLNNSTMQGFVEGWKQGIPFKNQQGIAQSDNFYKDKYCHSSTKVGWAGAPGGAWAYRREALNQLGGLIDYAILGSGDYHMATALMGFLRISLRKDYNIGFIEELLRWEYKALRHIKKNVGHMKGTLLHHWHGKMKDRGYEDRWKILVKHGFNPRIDLTRDVNGVYQLTDEKPQLRDDLKEYFSRRNEDSIDL